MKTITTASSAFPVVPSPPPESGRRGESELYLNTFAKSGPSLRIGYMVLPPHLAERYRRDFLFYSSTVPSFEQYTLSRFLGGAFRASHRPDAGGVPGPQRPLWPPASVTSPASPDPVRGGCQAPMLLRMENGLSEETLVRRAAEYGVAVYRSPTAVSLRRRPTRLPPWSWDTPVSRWRI